MKIHARWLFAAAVAAVAVGPAVAGTGHQWGDYRWGTSAAPITLKVSHKFATSGVTPDSGRTYWKSYYDIALGEWEAGKDPYGDPLTLQDQGQATTTFAMDGNGNFTGTSVEINSLACQPIEGEVLVCADKYGTDQGWVGIAQIDISGTRILWATAKFNDSYYDASSPYAGTYNKDAQRWFVACHEIGHTFGLGHLDTSFYNPNKGSCMDYTADPDGGGRNKDNRHPGDVDWQVLNSSTMYGSYSGGGGKKGGGGGGKPNRLDPFQFREVGSASPAPQAAASGRFGLIVGYDAEGRPNEYVRPRGNGRNLVTFVTWARGYRPEGSK